MLLINFPGAFHDKAGGRVAGNLSTCDGAQGIFNLMITQWGKGQTIFDDILPAMKHILELSHEMAKNDQLVHAKAYGLVSMASERLTSNYFGKHFFAGWTLLGFLGVCETFYQEYLEDASTQQTAAQENEHIPQRYMIRCLPNHNVGILQKDLSPALRLLPSTTATWCWNMVALPSRLREDTSLSHDYLSIAFEFENGRDLTYTWSWELSVDSGYGCPLPAWCDRGYHVVIRSGTTEVGQWLPEERNTFTDSVRYINERDEQRPVPQEIVRVWLIAGNRWQRHKGEMLIKDIPLLQSDDGGGSERVLL